MRVTKSPLPVATIALCALILSGCGEGQDQAGFTPPPTEVGVITLSSQAVPRTVELPGRVVAYATAEIRPQIDGILRERVFKEGAQVSKGDVLYKLDATEFQAALDAAAAALQKAQASEEGARTNFERAEKLSASNAGSTQDLDDARTTLLEAQADVAAEKANLDAAQINLDYATIRAPIDGLIGVSAVSVGSLLTANQSDVLATIRQIDPVYVDLVDTSVNLLRIRERVQAGTLGREDDGKLPRVQLRLENGTLYTPDGTLSLAEVVVSESTGTFSLRAEFANPDRILMPGMFVRATVDLGVTPSAYLLPQRAVQRNSTGQAVAYFVSDDGTVESRVLTSDGAVGNNWLVTDGVKDGDRLIVDGFQKISEGAAVSPVNVTMEEDGTVRQDTQAEPAGGAPAQGSGQ